MGRGWVVFLQAPFGDLGHLLLLFRREGLEWFEDLIPDVLGHVFFSENRHEVLEGIVFSFVEEDMKLDGSSTIVVVVAVHVNYLWFLCHTQIFLRK